MARKKISEINYSQTEGSQVSFAEFYSVYAVLEGFDHMRLTAAGITKGIPKDVLPIGKDQTMVAGAGRLGGVTYTNTSGRRIRVYVSCYLNVASAAIDFYRDGVVVQNFTAALSYAVSFAVDIPDGSTYGVFSPSGTPLITIWKEEK